MALRWHYPDYRPVRIFSHAELSYDPLAPASAQASITDAKAKRCDIEFLLKMMQDFVADRAVIAQADEGQSARPSMFHAAIAERPRWPHREAVFSTADWIGPSAPTDAYTVSRTCSTCSHCGPIFPHQLIQAGSALPSPHARAPCVSSSSSPCPSSRWSSRMIGGSERPCSTRVARMTVKLIKIISIGTETVCRCSRHRQRQGRRKRDDPAHAGPRNEKQARPREASDREPAGLALSHRGMSGSQRHPQEPHHDSGHADPRSGQQNWPNCPAGAASRNAPS